MKIETHHDIQWLTADLLTEAKVPHAMFLRSGGESHTPYASLNCSFDVGDIPSSVHKNRQKIQTLFPYHTLKEATQIHGKKILRVRKNSPNILPHADGLITNEPGLALLIKHADCQAALLYDPQNHAIGAIHAGWKGLRQNIYQETIHAMQREFNTNPHDLLVAISPSLGPENSEFIHYQQEWPKKYWSFRINETHFDLFAIANHQFTQTGVLPHHIEILSLNTYQDENKFFSFRRDKTTGRHATLIQLDANEIPSRG